MPGADFTHNNIADYDYDLPDRLIAQTPLPDRAASRLLHLERTTGAVFHRQFREVVGLFEAGDSVILNDTRVNAVRLEGRKPSGGQVEALLLHERRPGEFEALVKPSRRLPPGSKVDFAGVTGEIGESDGDGVRIVRFDSAAVPHLRAVGFTPLPPYITARLNDPERYQTAYATQAGSAAAPTAGLHFTSEILDALRAKGVGVGFVTLHVGIDTFRPVSVENLDAHVMHGEIATVGEEVAELVNRTAGRVIAVGTTTVRTLESFAVGPRRVEPGSRRTELFIRPGYQFRIVDGMFTNFHLPRTTMLAMISALASRDRIFEAYRQAIEQEYRFLSFGDSMLIL